MQHLLDQALSQGLTDQLDLDLGDDGVFVPPSTRACPRTLPEDCDPGDPHQIGRLQIDGRRYELDCRIDATTRCVLGYALRLVPTDALA